MTDWYAVDRGKLVPQADDTGKEAGVVRPVCAVLLFAAVIAVAIFVVSVMTAPGDAWVPKPTPAGQVSK